MISSTACKYIVQRQPHSLLKLSIELPQMCQRLRALIQQSPGCKDKGEGAYLNMEAQPAPDQTEWTTTGYTQAAMKKEYRAYASTRARSAMAPDTMVQAVAANCACQNSHHRTAEMPQPCCTNTQCCTM